MLIPVYLLFCLVQAEFKILWHRKLWHCFAIVFLIITPGLCGILCILAVLPVAHSNTPLDMSDTRSGKQVLIRFTGMLRGSPVF